jgi:hypothetical protein
VVCIDIVTGSVGGIAVEGYSWKFKEIAFAKGS